MLDQKDLRAIAGLMEEKIGASEARTAALIREEVGASETRMTARVGEMIEASEARTAARVKEETGGAEARLMAMMEAYFDPKFNLLADQIKLLQEKMVPEEAYEDLEDRVDVLEAAVREHSREIEGLKKAQ